MKNSLLLIFLAASFFSFSQAVPQKINYQGIARYSDGSPITNKTIAIRFRLLQGSAAGTSVFSENQNLTTGPLGVFSSQIGSVNSLGVVNWANGPFFLEVAIDTTNATSFVVFGTQELVSTPYALYAASAGTAPSPTLSFDMNNNVLNVGSNTVIIPPSTPSQSTTITTSGATSSTLTGTTYNLFTPSVTVSASPSGLGSVTGNYPNYVIQVLPTFSYNNASGAMVIANSASPAISYTNYFTPQLTFTNGVLSSGPTSNSVAISIANTPTLVSSGGLVNITSPVTNSFNINIAPTTLMGAGSATILGSHPNYTVTTPPALVPVNIVQGGAITVTGTNPNFTVSTPSVNVSASPSGLGSVTGSFPNYVVNVLPTFSYNNSAGAMVVANSASPAISYTYNITPALTFTNGTLYSGPVSNSVSIPGAATPTIVGVNAASVSSSGSSFTVSVPVTTLTGSGGAVVTGSAPNFTVSAPQAATVSGGGAASVSSVGNSYTVSVPVTTLVGTGGAVVSGSAPNFTVDAPLAPNIIGNGAASVSSSGNNYTVSVPATTIVAAGGTTVTGTAPNYTINTPQKVSITGGALGYPPGLLQVMGSYPNYSLLVTPNISYSQLTGSLTLSNQLFTTPTYTYSYDITPSLTRTNNIVQAGPATNTIAIVSPAAQAFAVSGSSLIALGGTQLMSTAFTKQATSSEIEVFVHTQASTALGLGNFTFELVVDGNTSAISSSHTMSGSSTEYITLKAVFSGLSAGAHTVGIRATPSVIGVSTTLNPNGYAGAKLILKETY